LIKTTNGFPSLYGGKCYKNQIRPLLKFNTISFCGKKTESGKAHLCPSNYFCYNHGKDQGLCLFRPRLVGELETSPNHPPIIDLSTDREYLKKYSNTPNPQQNQCGVINDNYYSCPKGLKCYTSPDSNKGWCGNEDPVYSNKVPIDCEGLQGCKTKKFSLNQKCGYS